MFAYCGNNPVNCADPSGALKEGVRAKFEHVYAYDGAGAGVAGVAIWLTLLLDSFFKSVVDATNQFVSDISSGYNQIQNSLDTIFSYDLYHIESGLADIANSFGLFKCKEAAQKMEEYLRKNGERGEVIIITYQQSIGYVWSDTLSKNISENGVHVGILYKGKVYCNVHPFGLPEEAWFADFLSTGTRTVIRIPF